MIPMQAAGLVLMAVGVLGLIALFDYRVGAENLGRVIDGRRIRR